MGRSARAAALGWGGVRGPWDDGPDPEENVVSSFAYEGTVEREGGGVRSRNGSVPPDARVASARGDEFSGPRGSVDGGVRIIVGGGCVG